MTKKRLLQFSARKLLFKLLYIEFKVIILRVKLVHFNQHKHFKPDEKSNTFHFNFSKVNVLLP